MNWIKKGVTIALCGVLTMASLYAMPNETIDAETRAPSLKNMNLGTGGIVDPTAGGNAAGSWEGSKVYYGLEHDQNLWRVLDSTNGLLLADDVVESPRVIDSYDVSNFNWESSALKAWLNGADYGENTAKFTTVEQGNIKQDITLLSYDELINSAYGFTNNENASNTRSVAKSMLEGWWVSSVGTDTSGGLAMLVKNDGSINTSGSRYFLPQEIRPSFMIDFNAVLFTTATGTVKADFGIVSDDNMSANVWNMTLQDGDTSFATAALSTTGTIGGSITVDVTTTGSGTYNQTSAFLEDASGSIVAYGKIGDAAAGTKTLNIPSALAAGNYTLHVFQEQVNAGTMTDYASQVTTGIIALNNTPATYDVTLTPGNNMTKNITSGNEIQTGLRGAMNTVEYVADNGYYFPIDYVGESKDGITLERVNVTQVKISGTPSADVHLVVPAPNVKSTPAAPTGVTGDINSIKNTTGDMEYAASPDASVWTTCSPDATNVGAGTWYVRYKATDTANAGNTVQVVVTAPVMTFDVTLTPGNNMTKTITSGNETQTGLHGAMNTVEYVADNGYYFPIDYVGESKDGITLERVNYSQVKISGTPSADVHLVVPAPNVKLTPAAPSDITGDVNSIKNTTIEMEYAASKDADVWISCTPDETIVGAGTWYVRYKATDTTKAGDALAVHVVGPVEKTFAVTVVNGTGSGSYHENDIVSITANRAPEGKQFKQWNIVTGTITIANPNSASTTFTMSAGAVHVEAVYEDIKVASDVPATGDQSQLTWLYMLLTISAAGMLAMRKKRI